MEYDYIETKKTIFPYLFIWNNILSIMLFSFTLKNLVQLFIILFNFWLFSSAVYILCWKVKINCSII